MALFGFFFVFPMHYLVVSPTPLFPSIGGNRALTLAMVRQIRAAGHRLSFLYSIQEDTTNQANLAMMREVDAFYLCAYSFNRRMEETNRAMMRTIATGATINYALDSWYDEDVGALVKLIYEKDPFEVMLGNYIWMSKAFESVPDQVIKIQQTHDSMSNRLLKLAKQGLPPSFFSVTPEDEATGLSRADINISLQYGEEFFFRTLTDKPVVTLQHPGPEIPFAPMNVPIGRKLRVGFIGSNNQLNIQTAKALVDALVHMPDLAARIELYMAGTVCNIFAVAPPFLTLMGPYEDIEKIYNVMDVMLNPMPDGTGLKIKSVEALHYHRPLLATDVGGEGLMSPYPFHRCASLIEVLGYVKLIADTPALLLDLQKAGLKVLTAYKDRLTCASAALTTPQHFLDAHRARTARSRSIPCGAATLSLYEPSLESGIALNTPTEAWIAHAASCVPLGGVWLDLSSGCGVRDLMLAQTCKPSKIIPMSFDPEEIELLKLNVLRNLGRELFDMRLLGYATGAVPGFGSVLCVNNERIVSPDEGDSVDPNQTIPMIVLDQFLNTEPRLDAVILDSVDPVPTLKGMEKTLARCHPVLFAEQNSESLENWAREWGYQISKKEGTSGLILTPPSQNTSPKILDVA